MTIAVIVDAIRTPMGRSKNGVFRHIRAEDLSAHLMKGLLDKYPEVRPADIDDIYWGCVQQTQEQGFNVARNAALLAGIPHSVPANTSNRLCASSMQALHDASRLIEVGEAHVCLVGGVEHMGHLPINHGANMHPQLSKTTAMASGMMGLTAEFLAQTHGISREAQDQFALRSQKKAAQAQKLGQFDTQILPTFGHDPLGNPTLQIHDEVIRPETTLEKLALLSPVFDKKKGTVTAGNASALADGASALLMCSLDYAKERQLPILGRVHSRSVVGCEPALMGYGPVPAIHKALKQAKLTLKDMNLIEINEAFAAQILPCLHDLNLLESLDEKVNLNGGAIALGHPLGCSGTRITASLLHQMHRQNAQFGIASLCVGLGQGIATVFEAYR
jgi:acetyl-CoA acyltransferase